MRVLGLWLCVVGALSAQTVTEETVSFGRFGTITLYSSAEHPSHVVLFVSGDGGWNQGVVDMARSLGSLDALVAGIDIIHYEKQLAASNEACSYPAADFEALSQFLQKKRGFPRYVTPLLVGYSSGATLVYATLVQAPENTFRGAISLGFCPDLPLGKPMCKGQGLAWDLLPKGKGYNFRPATKLARPWVALQGTIDQVCDPAATQKYVAQVGNGRVIMLPKVGHGFSVQSNWMPQFKEAFQSFQQDPNSAPPVPGPVADLPIVEQPATGSNHDWMTVILSGDGGWSFLEKALFSDLADQGIPVAGLNSLHYFWEKKDPEQMSKDLARILQHYLAAWNKRRVAVIGYSMGADVAPFMLSRLPADLASRVSLLSLVGPSAEVSFEFHFADWVGGLGDQGSFPVLPEIVKLKTPVLCVEGTEESDSLCPKLEGRGVKVLRLAGGHHFGGNYEAISTAVVAAMDGGG